jgi:hypothetical protein
MSDEGHGDPREPRYSLLSPDQLSARRTAWRRRRTRRRRATALVASAAGGVVIAAVWLTGGSSARRGFAAVSPPVSGGADHSVSARRLWVARRHAANKARYVDPLRAVSGLQPGRIDMGVDYVGSGPVLALGNGRVTMASNNDSGPSSCWGRTCWPGAIVVYRLVDGAFAGKYVYVAENVTVRVHAGQRVRAGERIAIVHDGFPYMETGWASGTGVETLAIARWVADGRGAELQQPFGAARRAGRTPPARRTPPAHASPLAEVAPERQNTNRPEVTGIDVGRLASGPPPRGELHRVF